MIQYIKKLFTPQAKEEKQDGWTKKQLSSGDILCTQYGAVNSMVLLKPCPHTDEVYYIADGGSTPMQRRIAIEAALTNASLNFTTEELQTAISDLVTLVHEEKSIVQARIKLQSACEAIVARTGGNVQKLFLEQLALPFMCLKGENPFMYSDAFNDRKLGILRAELYVSDFFLNIAREALTTLINT